MLWGKEDRGRCVWDCSRGTNECKKRKQSLRLSMLHAACDLRQSKAGIHSRIGEHDMPREEECLFLDSAMQICNLTDVNVVNVNGNEKIER